VTQRLGSQALETLFDLFVHRSYRAVVVNGRATLGHLQARWHLRIKRLPALLQATCMCAPTIAVINPQSHSKPEMEGKYL
jgi:hypothetical protein